METYASILSQFTRGFLCLFKSFSPLSQGTPEAVEEVGAMLVEKLPVFIQSGDLEVQERACCILQVSDVLQPLFLESYNLG